jgi:hypothetical protein
MTQGEAPRLDRTDWSGIIRRRAPARPNEPGGSAGARWKYLRAERAVRGHRARMDNLC